MGAVCYILLCSDGTLYTGWTGDIERRLRQHNNGSGGKYTRARRPVNLLYVEPQTDSTAARKREAAIKRLPRAAKLALVEKSPKSSKRKSSRKNPPGRTDKKSI